MARPEARSSSRAIAGATSRGTASDITNGTRSRSAGRLRKFQSVTQWSIDVAAGTWAVGPQNNYALNPSFEADRVTMTQPAGWVTSTTTTGATPFANLAGGHTGKWKWRLTDAAAYEASIAQTATGLPNGTYTLTAFIQSSGGQSVARVFARGFGGTEKDASVSSAIGTWTQVSIPGIAVSNGTALIGAETTASANQWVCCADDFTLVKNQRSGKTDPGSPASEQPWQTQPTAAASPGNSLRSSIDLGARGRPSASRFVPSTSSRCAASMTRTFAALGPLAKLKSVVH